MHMHSLKLLNSLCSNSIFYLLSLSLLCMSDVSAHRVRVLLAEGELTSESRWEFQTDAGYTLSDFHRPQAQYTCADQNIVLEYRDGKIVCNGKKVTTKALEIVPVDSTYAHGNRVYEGRILLVIDKKNWMLINNVDLEQYVYSVLRWESWPGWPLEVNKIFALMIRTYAVEKILERKKANPSAWYDIKATNAHQTYKGTHDSPILRQAIDATKGVIIAYKQYPIVAMYDSCCGGIIPAHCEDVDAKKYPYLARAHACEYCKPCKLYNWKVIYPLETFTELLKLEFPAMRVLKDIKVKRADKAGKVREILVKLPHANRTLTGKRLYNLCQDIKSFCYSIVKNETHVIVEGRGFGHHKGLCQWGAREMVKQGFMSKDIIEFYYPGTHLMCLVSPAEQEAPHAEL